MGQEIDYLLNLNIDGVNTYGEDQAVAVRVAEWLDTPQGEVWGAPQWGNKLKQYKHLPICDDTAAAIENSILMNLPVDVPSAVITHISVRPHEVDTYLIQVGVLGQQNIKKETRL